MSKQKFAWLPTKIKDFKRYGDIKYIWLCWYYKSKGNPDNYQGLNGSIYVDIPIRTSNNYW